MGLGLPGHFLALDAGHRLLQQQVGAACCPGLCLPPTTPSRRLPPCQPAPARPDAAAPLQVDLPSHLGLDLVHCERAADAVVASSGGGITLSQVRPGVLEWNSFWALTAPGCNPLCQTCHPGGLPVRPWSDAWLPPRA